MCTSVLVMKIYSESASDLFKMPSVFKLVINCFAVQVDWVMAPIRALLCNSMRGSNIMSCRVSEVTICNPWIPVVKYVEDVCIIL